MTEQSGAVIPSGWGLIDQHAAVGTSQELLESRVGRAHRGHDRRVRRSGPHPSPATITA
jgi:hypothetical protein